MSVLAYHLTWTTHGTWQPGEDRGWVKWGKAGIKPPDPEKERDPQAGLAESAVALTLEQRNLLQQSIRDFCQMHSWRLHAVRVRSNHVQVVVTADRGPDEVMNQLKAWCSRKLSEQAGLVGTGGKKTGRAHWFTEGGDKKLIGTQKYLENAVRYVQEGQ